MSVISTTTTLGSLVALYLRSKSTLFELRGRLISRLPRNRVPCDYVYLFVVVTITTNLNKVSGRSTFCRSDTEGLTSVRLEQKLIKREEAGVVTILLLPFVD